jgi:YegS/Rv2252/BmrU family lipid kinase
MKLRFIFNPCSGRNRRNARLRPLLQDYISARRLDAILATTEGPGHATALAREAVAEGCQRVVAVGGDGTMNEVAQALLHTPAALALVPCGSGNGLARHLRLPNSPVRALELAADPAAGAAVLDAGSVNGRPFFNVMGLGLDAEISRLFNQLVRRGLPAYARTVLAAFRNHRPERCEISDGLRRETLEILLIAVANSDQYGNGAYIAPRARVDDGLLDLVAILPVGMAGGAVLAARLFLGNLDRSARISRWRSPRFTIRRSAPGLVHTDGESFAASATVEIAVLPASLRVIAPSASRIPAPAVESPLPAFVAQQS